jgi:hypothetical protein
MNPLLALLLSLSAGSAPFAGFVAPRVAVRQVGEAAPLRVLSIQYSQRVLHNDVSLLVVNEGPSVPVAAVIQLEFTGANDELVSNALLTVVEHDASRKLVLELPEPVKNLPRSLTA